MTVCLLAPRYCNPHFLLIIFFSSLTSAPAAAFLSIMPFRVYAYREMKRVDASGLRTGLRKYLVNEVGAEPEAAACPDPFAARTILPPELLLCECGGWSCSCRWDHTRACHPEFTNIPSENE